MNLFRRITTTVITAVMLIGSYSVGTADSIANISIAPIMEEYEDCVAKSDPGLAYRCTMAESEFVWTSSLDPRVGPVYVEGGVFICASVPNMLVLATVHQDTDHNLFLELYSPTACNGEHAGTSSIIPLRVEINPQYDPREGPTMIAFNHGELFHKGMCMATAGNLGVFRRSNTDEIKVITFFAPIWCSGTA